MQTARKQQFVDAYLSLKGRGRGKRAAIAAGYSARTASAMACKLLKDPWVADRVGSGQERLAKKYEITAENVLQELAAIAMANMADFIKISPEGKVETDLRPVTRQQWKAVRECRIHADGSLTLKLKDDRAALVDLGKHLGLFKQFNPFDLPPDGDETDAESVPIRDSARALLFALATAMKAKASEAGTPPAAPTKH